MSTNGGGGGSNGPEPNAGQCSIEGVTKELKKKKYKGLIKRKI